jgi:hypothetical protein
VATYADFEWTTGWSEYDSYCLTFIRDATVTEVVDALPVVADLGERGGHALDAMSWDSWARIGSKRLLVGLLQLGFWTVAYEVNGYVGTTNTFMEPLSRGREIVAHHASAAGTGQFARYVDGQTRTMFEPLFASSRQGSAPDELLPLMRRVGGFRLTPDDEEDLEFHHGPATFAMTHELTGIRLQPYQLTHSVFRVIEVPVGP